MINRSNLQGGKHGMQVDAQRKRRRKNFLRLFSVFYFLTVTLIWVLMFFVTPSAPITMISIGTE